MATEIEHDSLQHSHQMLFQHPNHKKRKKRKKKKKNPQHLSDKRKNKKKRIKKEYLNEVLKNNIQGPFGYS